MKAHLFVCTRLPRFQSMILDAWSISLGLRRSKILRGWFWYASDLLNKLGVVQSLPPVLWCDNLGATDLTVNPVFHVKPSQKHIVIDFHFVREKVALGALDVRFISTNDQVVDVFTKPAIKFVLDRFRGNLNLVRTGSD